MPNYRVKYDPDRISYNDLLSCSRDTRSDFVEPAGSGCGNEYRSVIFYTTDDQKREAEALIDQLNNSDPAVRGS